jgi:hypothetical protein
MKGLLLKEIILEYLLEKEKDKTDKTGLKAFQSRQKHQDIL